MDRLATSMRISLIIVGRFSCGIRREITMISKKSFVCTTLLLSLISITSYLVYASSSKSKGCSTISTNNLQLDSTQKYPLIKEVNGESSLLTIYGLTNDNSISKGKIVFITPLGVSMAYIKDLSLNLVKGKDIQYIVRTIMLQTIDQSYKYLSANLPNAPTRNPDFKTYL
jgi:hypothetical protein